MTLQKFIRRALYSIVPYRYTLAYDYTIERYRGRLEEELLLLENLTEGREVAIDVGANKGYYSYRMSRLFRHVFSFEPIPPMAERLARTGIPNVTVEQVALGAQNASEHFFIPTRRGKVFDGWASFDRDNMPDRDDVKKLAVTVARLDDYGIPDVSFIKIDVEGHEKKVLQGARNTIEIHRPVVLVEVKEENRSDVAAYFNGLEYSCYVLAEGEKRDLASQRAIEEYRGSRDNFVFFPL